MKFKKLFLFLIIPGLLVYSRPENRTLTTPETSGYTKTSSYNDVMKFLVSMQKKSDNIKIGTLCKSSEGKPIPLVIASKQGISSVYRKNILGIPAVLIMGNIHGGEVEGKEASQMVIRDIATGKFDSILKSQIILFIPIFNADGNDKMGNNRRDNGPELAGLRHNGQNLDLNRDYLKLESPEVKALVKLFSEWNPVLFVDLHTTDGSYHREPVTFATLSNPNSSKIMTGYMWKKLFPSVQKILKKKYGTDSIPYGNFMDRKKPESGWANHAYEARYGTNYAGLRNIFTILDENYSHSDFKTRVISSYNFIHSILEYTSNNIEEMEKIRQQVNLTTSKNYFHKKHILRFKTEKMFDFIIKSYVFEIKKIKPEEKSKFPPWFGDFYVKKTDKFRNYKVPYFGKAAGTDFVNLPEGYFILPYHKNIEVKLKSHGIEVSKLKEEFTCDLENFKLKELKYGKVIFQGHTFIEAKGEYVNKVTTIPKGALYISMKQPLARIIAELLEPLAKDSFLSWGFFNREIIKQWSRRPGIYPVFRLMKCNQKPVTIQE